MQGSAIVQLFFSLLHSPVGKGKEAISFNATAASQYHDLASAKSHLMKHMKSVAGLSPSYFFTKSAVIFTFIIVLRLVLTVHVIRFIAVTV